MPRGRLGKYRKRVNRRCPLSSNRPSICLLSLRCIGTLSITVQRLAKFCNRAFSGRSRWFGAPQAKKMFSFTELPRTSNLEVLLHLEKLKICQWWEYHHRAGVLWQYFPLILQEVVSISVSKGLFEYQAHHKVLDEPKQLSCLMVRYNNFGGYETL